MSIAIGTFVDIESKYYFQNFYVNEVREWENQKYQFAGFGYGGSSSDLQSGNIDASLVFRVNDLSLNMAVEASNNRWIVVVKTVWLDPDSLEEKANYMRDTFMITGFDHDSLTLTLRLSSPMDAVTAEVPRRRLTEQLVGAMPSTGEISLL